MIQPLEIIMPDESCDALSKKCRETIFVYQQERNSLASIPVRLEEMPKAQVDVEQFQSALYQMNGETKENEDSTNFETNFETNAFSSKCSETILSSQQEGDSVAAKGREKDKGVGKLRQLWPSFSLSLSR